MRNAILGNNLKPRQENKILVPHRGAFQNLRRALRSFYMGDPLRSSRTAEILAHSLADFCDQKVDRHLNL